MILVWFNNKKTKEINAMHLHNIQVVYEVWFNWALDASYGAECNFQGLEDNTRFMLSVMYL